MHDEHFMRRALEIAEQGRYTVSPNPMVGCVVVRDGAILAEGWHRRAGEPHAEIRALETCPDARGATLYVTLEPCAHEGRTPPCSERVIASGVSRVVVAMRDPNTLVDGKGLAQLRAAGVEVEVGLLEAEARRLNEKFVWAMSQKLPFVLLKAAMTLDGKLATVTRESQWITSEDAREKSLSFREEYDAILVGSGTVEADNPRLTRRLGWSDSAAGWTRVVVDGTGTLSPHAQLFNGGGRTLLFSPAPPEGLPNGIEAVRLDAEEGRLDLGLVLSELYARGVQSLIVEGGSQLHSDFIRRSLWQKLVLFVAPAIVGGAEAPSIFSGEAVSRLTDAYRFRFDRVEFTGRDLMITAYPSTLG